MKRTIIAVSMFVLFAFVVVGLAQAGIMDLPNKLTIKQINAISILDKPQNVLRILVTFDNASENSVRIRKGSFKVFMNPESKDYLTEDKRKSLHSGCKKLKPNRRLYLGNAKIGYGSDVKSNFAARLRYFEIAPQTQTDTILEIPLKMHEVERQLLIYRLINYMGYPDSTKKILLEGKAKVGLGVEKGWAYQEIELELNFVPKIQREVLME